MGMLMGWKGEGTYDDQIRRSLRASGNLLVTNCFARMDMDMGDLQVKSAWLYKSGRTVVFQIAAIVALEAC